MALRRKIRPRFRLPRRYSRRSSLLFAGVVRGKLHLTVGLPNKSMLVLTCPSDSASCVFEACFGPCLLSARVALHFQWRAASPRIMRVTSRAERAELFRDVAAPARPPNCSELQG